MILQRLREIMRLPSVLHSDFDLLVRGGDMGAPKGLGYGSPQPGTAGVRIEYLGDFEGAGLPVSMWLSPRGSVCWFHEPVDASVSRLHVMIISQFIARAVQDQDGLLLHGALAELDGAGVVLAGPSGMGKTTASNRLPPPWRSRSDDAVLVVKGADGRYWAHPWPTWSRTRRSCSVDPSWDVQRAVPLAALCFLGRSEADAITPMGSGNAAGLLARSAEQAAALMPYTSIEDRRAKRVQRLDNACALSRSVPSYQLDLSLTGTFWRLLEDALRMQTGTQSGRFGAEPAAPAT